MKKHLFTALFLLAVGSIYAQLNTTFRSNLSYGSSALANIGGYVDSLGNEYALVGYDKGLSIVDVTDPVNPFIAFDVQGPNSIWREVKTWQKFAYVTTEGGGGLQVIDLSNLPASVSHTQWTGDGAISGQLGSIHALHVDNGYVYLHGSNLFGGATVIANLNNPAIPSYEGFTPGGYVHDGYVRNDTLWACHIYNGWFSAIDVHNKANPIQLATKNTPSNFTHNCWLNDAGSVLFTTDEVSNSFLTSYDVTNVNNIKELDRIQVTPNSGSWIHNTHTLNDYEIVSWYNDGIAIVDVARPDNMIIVGTYDTYAQGCCSGEDGCWGVYPYLPSGNIVCSDITNGLYVLTPNYVRGCYLEGIVTDTVTGAPLNSVTVEILNQNVSKNNKLNGEYKTGLATAGLYDVQFSKAGYITKIIYGVSLQNGVLTTLNVQLKELFSLTVSGNIKETGSGNSIQGVQVNFSNSLYQISGLTDVNGDFSISGFYPDFYDITIGKWGYKTYCSTTVDINPTTNIINTSLDAGYYDDFSLDFGWVSSGTSLNLWERGIPVGTVLGTATANPNVDVGGDCGGYCFVTDNGGGVPTAHDVDGGPTILTSPIFDGTKYSNPILSYSSWFFDGVINNHFPDDTLIISLSNGASTVELERITPTSVGNGTWVNKSFAINSFLPLTSNMTLQLSTSDPNVWSNVVEGGIDKFMIVESVGLTDKNSPDLNIIAIPNPFNNSVKINYDLKKSNDIYNLTITDITGRIIESRLLNNNVGSIETGSKWQAGVYLAQIRSNNGDSKVIRITKGK